MLKQVRNPNTKRMEYALVSVSSPGKVLEYFGANKPSAQRVARAEARVEMFKAMKKKK